MTKVLLSLFFIAILWATALSEDSQPVFAQRGGEVVGEIVVRGNKAVSEATIRALMVTRVGQVYQPGQLRQDEQRLMATNQFQAVKVYGLFLDNQKWRVVVEVSEWPVIREFSVIGNTVVPTEKIIAELRNKVGEPFNPTHLEMDAMTIQDVYRAEGYFARVVKYEPSAEDSSIVIIELLEARVANIEIVGLTRTKKSVVMRLFDTKVGQLLNFDTLNEDLRRLVNTRWFESVKPDVVDPELGKFVIVVEVVEARTGSFNVGVQLDPKSRLAGLLTLSDSNFYGTGKTLGVNIQQSAQGLGTSAKLDYADPFMDSKRRSLVASVFSQETLIFGASVFGGGGGPTNTRFAQRRTGASISFAAPVSKTIHAFVGLQGQGINSRDFVIDPGEEFVVQDGTTIGLTIGATRNRRDFNIEPAKGDWLKVTLEPSWANITSAGGQNTGFPYLGKHFYTKFTVDYRSYFSKEPVRKPDEFDEPRRVLASRIFAGAILGKVVPFSDQFFIGGSDGVRGYDEDRFWGKNALLLQVEYRHPIQKSFYAVAFVDYGGAWGGYGGVQSFTQSSSPELHLGYGLGVNFRTPFGPIRLDIGIGEDGKAKTHFLIGGSF